MLGKVVIPKLRNTIIYILTELQEKEREEKFRLKRFNQLAEKHNRAAAIKLCHCCLKVFQEQYEKPLSMCAVCARALTKDIKQKQEKEVVMCRNDGTELLELLDTHTKEDLKLTKASHGLHSASMEQLVARSGQIKLTAIDPDQIFHQISISSFAEKSRLYPCTSVKPLVGSCCVHKLVTYKEASSHLHLPSDQNFKMYSPPGSQEEELIIYDEKDITDDIFNVENIPVITSVETPLVLVESEEQVLEEPVISFVDIPLESALAATPFDNLVASAIKNTTSKTSQTSEQYKMPHSLPYEDVVSLKSEVLYIMPQNLDTIQNSDKKYIKYLSSYATKNDVVRPEISSVLRTPCIYHVDTEATSGESSSTTKKAGSLKSGTEKYQKSVKIRKYRNPDGSVTEEKKIVERSSTINKGNINDLYSSDEDETKFDDKYFDSLFKDVPNELDEDDLDFLVNTNNKEKKTSISRKTKSEKLRTSEPMADLQLKTSISGNIVSSEAEFVSNDDNSRIYYGHSDIRRNRPVKEFSKESEKEIQSKLMDQISKKSSDVASISRKSKSESINTSAPMSTPQLKTSISSKVVSSKTDNSTYKDNSVVSNAHSDINRNRPVTQLSKDSEKIIKPEIIDQFSKTSSHATIHSIPVNNKQNVLTRSTSADAKMIKNEATTTYNDNSVVSYVRSDINRNHPVSQIPKDSEKKIQSEILGQISKTSHATIHSISANKKQNVVTRSTSADATIIKNEATNTDIKLEDTAHNTNLKRKIREEYNKLITKTGKNPNEKDFNIFSKEMYDKYGIQLNEMQDNTGDMKKPLEQKANTTEEFETKALKELEKEEEILHEILNGIRSETKDVVNRKRQGREDTIREMESKSNNTNLSVKVFLDQSSNKPLNTEENIKEEKNITLSRENLRFSAQIEKDDKNVINNPDYTNEQNKKIIGSDEIYEVPKRGDVKMQGIKILDSSQSDNSVAKTAVEMFNKHQVQIWDSEDDPKGVVQSAVNKFNEEQTRPQNITDSRATKLEETKTRYIENETKLKEEDKPTFIIKEIEIVDKQVPIKMTLESSVERELRAFKSPHPDKITTDSDVTSKSERIIKEQFLTAGNSKKAATMSNDTMTAHEVKRSESIKKVVSLPEPEISTESHLKAKITRIKENNRQETFELHSVYKEISTSSQVSEVSKLPSKQSSSTRRDDNISVIKQEESEVDTTIAMNDVNVESDERGRKIIICKNCLMALCGFIPSKIVEETKVSADCQLCRLKEKQIVALRNSNCSDTTEETASFSCISDGEGQVCVPPVLPSIKCYDKETRSNKYPCGRPKEDQKLVFFRDASRNEVEQDVINDDVTNFDITSSPHTSVLDKPTVSNALIEPIVATVTASTEQNFVEMVAKSLIRLLGMEQKNQTTEMVSPCESVEMYESCESETFDVPCSPKICTQEAATNTKISSRYDVRCLRDLPPFKKGLVKCDAESNKCVNSDITLEITRNRELRLKSESSHSLDNTCYRNKNTSTKTEKCEYICKNKRK